MFRCLFILLLFVSIGSVSAITTQQWSGELEKGDSFTWIFDLYKLNGEVVTTPVNPEVNIIQGTEMEITIIDDIEDLDYYLLLYEVLNVSDYFRMELDGKVYTGEELLQTINFYIIPVMLQYFPGVETINTLSEQIFRFDGQSGEVSFFNRYNLEYELPNEVVDGQWDVDTGLLNEFYNFQEYDNGFTREVHVYREMSFWERYSPEIIFFIQVASIIILILLMYKYRNIIFQRIQNLKS